MDANGQVWVLINNENGELVPPIEEAGNPFLAFRSEADAHESALMHAEVYDMDCRVAEYAPGMGAGKP